MRNIYQWAFGPLVSANRYCSGFTTMGATVSILFFIMLTLTACRTTSSHEAHPGEFTREFGAAGLTLGTIKALDTGNTNKAYQVSLILLRESITRAEELARGNGAPKEHRQILSSLSKTTLTHLEKFKERSAQNASTDYLALEITKVLEKVLTEKEDAARLSALREFFASRFVKERSVIEENNKAFNE